MFTQMFTQIRQTKPSQTFHRTLARWLILALLFSQGAHLYLHAQEAATHQTYSVALASAHFGSSHSDHQDGRAAGTDEGVSNGHVSLMSLLKHFSDASLGVLFSFLLAVLLLPFVRDSFVYARMAPPRLSCGHYFTPPLRAPPR